MDVDLLASARLNRLLLDQPAADVVRVAEEPKSSCHEKSLDECHGISCLHSLYPSPFSNRIELFACEFLLVERYNKFECRQSLFGVAAELLDCLDFVQLSLFILLAKKHEA